MVTNSVNSHHHSTSVNGKTLDLAANSQQDKDREYQQRLIRLYTDYVCRTGKVDYPPLKKFLVKFASTDTQTTEIYEQKDFQTENFQKAIASLREIRYRVTESIAKIKYILGTAIADERELSLDLKTEYRELENYLGQLVKITNKYGFLATASEEITKKLGDLNYFREYIKQSFNLSQLDRKLKHRKIQSSSRLNRYLEQLMDTVHTLVNLLEKTIEYEQD